MAGEPAAAVETPVAVPAVAEAAVAAPAVEAVAAAEPAKETPAVEPAKEAAPAKAAEEAKADAPKSEPSLLEAADGKTKEEAKTDTKAEPSKDAKTDPAPAEAAKDDKSKDAAKATDPVKAEATAEAPAPIKYEAFKVPDGIKLDEKEVAKFTDIIGAKQLPQEDAQKLLDLYVEQRKQDFETARQEQRTVWNKLNDTWKTDTRKELGNHYETDLAMAKAVIEEYGGNAEQVRELMAHVTNNGMGNYIGFIRTMRNIGRALNVYEDSAVPANPTAPKMPKTPGNRGWYDKTEMGNGAAKS